MNQQVANSIEIRASRLCNQQYATYPDKNKRYPRPDRSIDKEFKFNPGTDRVGPHFSETLLPFVSFIRSALIRHLSILRKEFFFFFIIFSATTRINLKRGAIFSTQICIPVLLRDYFSINVEQFSIIVKM